jgi:hypothetical protein
MFLSVGNMRLAKVFLIFQHQGAPAKALCALILPVHCAQYYLRLNYCLSWQRNWTYFLRQMWSPYETCQGGNLDGYPSGSIDGGERLATQQTPDSNQHEKCLFEKRYNIYIIYISIYII